MCISLSIYGTRIYAVTTVYLSWLLWAKYPFIHRHKQVHTIIVGLTNSIKNRKEDFQQSMIEFAFGLNFPRTHQQLGTPKTRKGFINSRDTAHASATLRSVLSPSNFGNHCGPMELWATTSNMPLCEGDGEPWTFLDLCFLLNMPVFCNLLVTDHPFHSGFVDSHLSTEPWPNPWPPSDYSGHNAFLHAVVILVDSARWCYMWSVRLDTSFQLYTNRSSSFSIWLPWHINKRKEMDKAMFEQASLPKIPLKPP